MAFAQRYSQKKEMSDALDRRILAAELSVCSPTSRLPPSRMMNEVLKYRGDEAPMPAEAVQGTVAAALKRKKERQAAVALAVAEKEVEIMSPRSARAAAILAEKERQQADEAERAKEEALAEAKSAAVEREAEMREAAVAPLCEALAAAVVETRQIKMATACAVAEREREVLPVIVANALSPRGSTQSLK